MNSLSYSIWVNTSHSTSQTVTASSDFKPLQDKALRKRNLSGLGLRVEKSTSPGGLFLDLPVISQNKSWLIIPQLASKAINFGGLGAEPPSLNPQPQNQHKYTTGSVV